MLTGKIIIGGKIYPHAALVRTNVTCFLSQPDAPTVIELQNFFAKDLLGTILKKTGVSSRLPTSARGYFPIFKTLAKIS